MADVLITAKDNGKSLSLAIGTRLCLRLEENPTTGFLWHVSSKPTSSLSLVSDDYTPSRSSAVGGGGVRQFIFVAKQLGDFSVEFINRRSWEDESKASARFLVKVTVYEKD